MSTVPQHAASTSPSVTPVNLSGKRIFITGATGFVAHPIVEALSKTNQVFAGARYKKEEDKAKIINFGATPVIFDLGGEDWSQLPKDIDYVLNLAVAKSNKWHIALPVNAEALGKLMLRYRDVDAFLHVSSTGVYEYAGHEPRSETSSYG